AMEVHAALQAEGVALRVVSLPCTSVFDRQPDDYRAAVLPAGVPRLAIEAARSDGWWKYLAGVRGAVVGIDRFGESAPAGDLLRKFGFTVDAVLERARALLSAT
ncbi:MAG: transketolase, partial [Proteobacteria bacterium]|nr:transketolase [Pseudomonadota bacterium]